MERRKVRITYSRMRASINGVMLERKDGEPWSEIFLEETSPGIYRDVNNKIWKPVAWNDKGQITEIELVNGGNQ